MARIKTLSKTLPMVHALRATISRCAPSFANGLKPSKASWLEPDAYAAYHGVREVLDELEKLLLKTRPEQPLDYLQRILQKMERHQLEGSRSGRPTRRRGLNRPPKDFRSSKLGKFRMSSSSVIDKDSEASSHIKAGPLGIGCFIRPDMLSVKRSISVPNGLAKLKSFDDLPFAEESRPPILPRAISERGCTSITESMASSPFKRPNPAAAATAAAKLSDLHLASSSSDEAAAAAAVRSLSPNLRLSSSLAKKKKKMEGRKRRTYSQEKINFSSSAKLDSGHHVPSVGMLMKPLLLQEFQLKCYVGCDIGGTLSKITFFEPFDCKRPDIRRRTEFLKSSTTYGLTGRRDAKLEIERWGGKFHFLSFHTKHLDGAVNILKTHSAHHEFADASIPMTGGGAYKYERFLQDELRMGIHKVDELTCLLTGLNFTLENVPDECFYLEHKSPEQLPYRHSHSMQGVFPYLLVNIGSGVSILKVESEKKFKRVGGSCLGGGTYWGLCRLLLGAKTFKEAMALGTEGDHHNVDMLVGDIYGGDYGRFNLKASTVASAFGKLVMHEELQVSPADAAASLLHMIGANIAQLAYLCAREHGVSRILFAGNFLRMNMTSAIFLSSSINYWSQGKMKALFLRHEGYFGSLGAMLMSKDTTTACREVRNDDKRQQQQQQQQQQHNTNQNQQHPQQRVREDGVEEEKGRKRQQAQEKKELEVCST